MELREFIDEQVDLLITGEAGEKDVLENIKSYVNIKDMSLDSYINHCMSINKLIAIKELMLSK